MCNTKKDRSIRSFFMWKNRDFTGGRSLTAPCDPNFWLFLFRDLTSRGSYDTIYWLNA